MLATLILAAAVGQCSSGNCARPAATYYVQPRRQVYQYAAPPAYGHDAYRPAAPGVYHNLPPLPAVSPVPTHDDRGRLLRRHRGAVVTYYR